MPKRVYLEKAYRDNFGRMMYRNVANDTWYKDTTLNEDVERSQDLHTFTKDGEPDCPLAEGIKIIMVCSKKGEGCCIEE